MAKLPRPENRARRRPDADLGQADGADPNDFARHQLHRGDAEPSSTSTTREDFSSITERMT